MKMKFVDQISKGYWYTNRPFRANYKVERHKQPFSVSKDYDQNTTFVSKFLQIFLEPTQNIYAYVCVCKYVQCTYERLGFAHNFGALSTLTQKAYKIYSAFPFEAKIECLDLIHTAA